MDLNYRDLTLYLIDYFEQKFQPKSFLVPVFNYEFLKGKPFNLKETKSQVGRFSEECRIIFQNDNNRSLNPVFSHLDINNHFHFDQLEDTAFGNSSLFPVLAKEGYYIINVNMDLFIATHRHYLEEKLKVSYRYYKTFRSKFSKDGENYIDLDFEYYVRDLESNTVFKKRKMEEDFINYGILQKVNESTFGYSYIHSKDLDNFIIPKLNMNEKYMISDE